MPEDLAHRIAICAAFVAREIEEAQMRGAPGRWSWLLRRLSRLVPRSKDAVEESISSEHRAIVAAFGVIRPEVRTRAARTTVRLRRHEAIETHSPWRDLDPAAERASALSALRRVDEAEMALLAALGNYSRSARFAYVEEAVCVLDSMVAVHALWRAAPSVATYSLEAECLERALEDTIGSAACGFFVKHVRDGFALLAGDPSARPPTDASAFARASIRSWITGGAWAGRAYEPDTSGVWFLGDVQRRFEASQRAWQCSLDAEKRKEDEAERAARDEERTRERAATALERDRKTKAAAAEKKHRAEEEKRAKREAREQEIREREQEAREAREREQRAEEARLDAWIQAEQDRQIDAVITADLRARGVAPTPAAIRRERKFRGADRPGGGYAVW